MEPRAPWFSQESAAETKARARKVLGVLRKAYPDAKTALNHSSPFELLVATVLSAQSTDKKINEITPALFARFPGPREFLASKPGEIETAIKQSGFFNQKARSIRGLSRVLVEEFGGEVPSTMEELLRLPGVARKTANVVLANAFGINVGIAVDTHVHRLSWRFGFSSENDPVKVEQDLMALFPRTRWFDVTHLLIEHGRTVCSARTPACGDCPVARSCPASRAGSDR